MVGAQQEYTGFFLLPCVRFDALQTILKSFHLNQAEKLPQMFGLLGDNIFKKGQARFDSFFP